MEFARSIDQIITRHLDELKKRGVLSVRPGYQVAGGWPTKKPAIVVIVNRKHDDLAPQDRLPETIEGVGVDVREATPLQRLRATNPTLYMGVAAAARPELERPVFPFERDLTGQLLAPLSATVESMRRAVKQQLPYVPAGGRFAEARDRHNDHHMSRQPRRGMADPEGVLRRDNQDAHGRYVRFYRHAHR